MAQYGDLDSTFNINGRVTTGFLPHSGHANSGGLQSDGKIVVAGLAVTGADYDFALARYHTDGSPDDSFGTDGKVT
ncbi:MAG TPA: delta-60 repeat domain-containing protein, partial [Saprospiraceae bacterium]|nr:delta-60 repeat domain-containing protein [Saprospiraceae bacterium]